MAAVTYRLTWPDRARSTVTVTVDAQGCARVRVAGRCDALSDLFGCRTDRGIETELRHLAQSNGIVVVRDVRVD